MPLFEGKTAIQVVTAEDIKQLTGIKAEDFQFDGVTPDFDTMLGKWTEQAASHIRVRIKKTVAVTADEYEAIRDILLRTVAKMVAIAQQQRSSPIVQTGDFAVGILNTADVTKDLDSELKPFILKTSHISFFSSGDEWIDPEAPV